MNKIHHISHHWFLFYFALIHFTDGSKRLAVLFWYGQQHRYFLMLPPLRGEIVKAMRVREDEREDE